MKVLLAEAVNSPLDQLRGLEVGARDELWRDRKSLLAAVASCGGFLSATRPGWTPS